MFRSRSVGVIFILVGVWAAFTMGVALEGDNQRPEKRQIYREAVLPAKGGVIPQGAFNLQRLQHNVHDAVGIEAPDGIIYIPRNTDIRPGTPDPEDEAEILTLTSDVFGDPLEYSLLSQPRPQPTTYLLRRPVSDNLLAPVPQHYVEAPLRFPTYYQPRIPWTVYQTHPTLLLSGYPGFY